MGDVHDEQARKIVAEHNRDAGRQDRRDWTELISTALRAAADEARREASAAIGEVWDKLLDHPGFHTQIVGSEADVLYGTFCRLLGGTPPQPDPVGSGHR